MMRTCPVCGQLVKATVVLACGHEGRIRPGEVVNGSMSDAMRAWYDSLRAKTAALQARGVKIGDKELLTHWHRQYIVRVMRLFNAERAENGLSELNLVEFDGFLGGIHENEARKFVGEAFELAGEPDTAWQKRASQAERLFGVKIELSDAAAEAEIEKWLADQRAKEEATV